MSATLQRWYTSHHAGVAISMTLDQALSASHPGPCDADVLALSREPEIHAQLVKLDPAHVAAELRECGAWCPRELADHKQNLQRLLWLAAADIVEEAKTNDDA